MVSACSSNRRKAAYVTSNTKKMRKTTTIVLIIIVLWISVLISIIRNPQFGVQFIFGCIGLIVSSTTLLMRKKDLSLGILIFALFLSTFNVIIFNESFSIKFGFISLIPFLLLVTLIFSNFGELIDLREKWFGVETVEVERSQLNKIAFYKREFQNLSSEELIKIENDNKITKEARIAVKQLLSERDNTMYIS